VDVDVTAIRLDVREIVREELRAALTSGGTNGGATEESKAERALPTAEQEQAGNQGHSIVQRALTRGEWTDENRAEFGVLLSQMTPEDRDALLAQFAQAINSQQLKVTTTGLPL
jgi:hypothetical protein